MTQRTSGAPKEGADTDSKWLRCVELPRLYASFGDDQEFFRDMIGLFRQSSEQCLSQFETAIKTSNDENMLVAAVGFVGLISIYSNQLALKMGKAVDQLDSCDIVFAWALFAKMKEITEDVLQDLLALAHAERAPEPAPCSNSFLLANWRQIARSAADFQGALTTL